MAAGDRIDIIRPQVFCSESGPDRDPQLVMHRGLLMYPLLKSDRQGFYFDFRLNTNGTPVLGLTLQVPVVDLEDAGRVVRLGLTFKRIVGGTDTLDIGSNAGTEKTVDITTDSTAGEVTLSAVDILAAENDASVAAGDRLLCYFRRVGSASQDTHRGRVLIGAIEIRERAAT